MPTTLVSSAELAAHPQWRVFDCRHDLAKPALGEGQYREAHIPGALFAHLDRDLSAPKTGRNGRHPLPQPDVFTTWLGGCGVKPSDQVVCYDAGNGAMAARLWWMLRWIGHETVAVLDGGLAKWAAEKRPLTSEVPRFAPSHYQQESKGQPAVDVSEVMRQGSEMLLLDARAPARYRGEQEPIDPVAGRIPGARNRFNMDNVSPQGTFKSAGELRREFQAVLGDRAPSEAVHYCGSGVAACHNLLAMEVAGLPGGRLFAGSWSEWSADPNRPVEKGPA
jgi:thiosulfate/3-mercaptopyruvate sulfurtransferase